MGAITAADFYGKDAFSDLILKFGSRTFKAHNIVICSRSKNFTKLCGPESRFAERDQAVIELKGDENENAVQAWLCWLYTDDYLKSVAVSEQSRPFFDVTGETSHKSCICCPE
jgi:hypothetical protein